MAGMIPDAAFWLLGGAVAIMIAGWWACLVASVRLFTAPPPSPRPLLPMTLIKPVKGLDDGLDANFESIARSDPEGRLQVIVAVESDADPAFAAATAFSRRHPERDILVLATGPSGARMGKVHNMIEALPRAAHPFVIFSDSDVETTPRLLLETSRAFEDGLEAVFAVPRQRRGEGLPGVLLEIAMNHSFGIGAALGWRLIGFTHCAGAWMGYTREILERSGGLEPIAHAIADDFALSRRVAKAGARGRLLAAPVLLREAGGTVPETARHLLKWAVIIRWSLPLVYLSIPFFNMGLAATALAALALATGRHVAPALSLAACAFVTRGLVALLHDVLVGEGALALPWYGVLAFTDLGVLGFWLAGFRSTIGWRGTTYRLRWGGAAEVILDDSRRGCYTPGACPPAPS
jgi:ceramide glucosyltransferase